LLDRSARFLDIAAQLGDDAQQRLLALDFPTADEDSLAVFRDEVKRPAVAVHEVHQGAHASRVALAAVEIKIPLMTHEERNKYIADCCDGFKGQLLARADRIPRDRDCAEIQQWIMDTARDAWTVKMTPTRKHRYQMAKQIRGL
jgi:hypothetical protein